MNAAITLPLVRAAAPDDFPQLMEFCHLLYKENGAVSVHWPTVEIMMMNGVNGDGACVGVIGPVGAVEGMIYLRISTMWYSEDAILEEIFNFVPRKYRKSRNAQALIEFAKNAAKRFDVPLLIGVLSKKKTRAKVRFYSQHLGEPSGAFFWYRGE